MNCSACGATLGAGDRFCTDCGSPGAAGGQRCPACGVVVRGNARFCIKCGTSLPAKLSERAPHANRWRTSPRAHPPPIAVLVVTAGCTLGLAIYLSLSIGGGGEARNASGAAATISGTLGTFHANVGDFSVKHAFTVLYGNYDPNLDGAFWKATAAPKPLAEWNGRSLFIRPLISREFIDGGNTRHLLVTNSLDVRDGDVVKQGTGCRTCGSLIGAAIFERKSEGWKLISRHDFLTVDGKWGAPPNVSVAFSRPGGFELQFEPRRADSREGARAPYTIVLNERKERPGAVARTTAREEAPR